MEGRVREAQGTAENLYGQAKDAVRHAADEAYDLADDAYENGSRYLRQGSREVGAYVSDAPVTSLLIAGAVGFGSAFSSAASDPFDLPTSSTHRSARVTTTTSLSPVATADTRAVLLNEVSLGAIFAAPSLPLSPRSC